MITLPKWLQNTRTMQISSVDVVLIFALVLKIHGTPAAIRQTAMNIRFKVCMEHQPKMKMLAREKDDEKVMRCALTIVQRATDQLGILPGEVFLPKQEIQPPRCHMKPMRLAGYHSHRHWRCQHCTHTKPLEV
ncbi:hypothetical protein D3C85_794910 [compost metagenome]